MSDKIPFKIFADVVKNLERVINKFHIKLRSNEKESFILLYAYVFN